MRVGAIVLKLMLADTRFNNYVGGAAEFANAQKYNLKQDSLFVIPLIENAAENTNDNEIKQTITERFGVVCVSRTDRRQNNKSGIIAYDQLHNDRNDIFKALLGWTMPEAESMISYRGGRLLDINPVYMWYQFEFEYDARIVKDSIVVTQRETQTQELSDIAEDVAKEEYGLQTTGKYANMTIEQIRDEISNPDTPDNFNTIYMQLIQSPSADLPYTGTLPKSDNFPDVLIPDIAQWIDMTEHPEDGAYGRGFASSFDFYSGS